MELNSPPDSHEALESPDYPEELPFMEDDEEIPKKTKQNASISTVLIHSESN